jgi:hypothetical protein
MASNINPNNIDGSYPVAGQDNNSQGFRDNFTNIKVNFQDAEDEINDLQSKVLLKAALLGSTGLVNNMNNNLIYAANIQDFSATAVALSATSGTIDLNYASGHYQTISTSGLVSLTFSNFPSAGYFGVLRIAINITNVAHTLTLPAAVSRGLSGIQGISPGTAGVSNTITFGATGYYQFQFTSSDGGSTITLFDLNRALTDFTTFSATTFSATGNITGGNITTAGTANLTTIVGSTASLTGNVTGGNVRTVGTVSSTGNITGSNVIANLTPPAGTVAQAPFLFTSGTNLTTPVGGAMEYDGAVGYLTPSTNRGVLSSQHFITLTSDYTASDSASAQQVFNSTTNGAIALSATKTYLFDAVYYITRAAGSTSHTLRTLFNSTSALTSITYIAETTSTTGNTLGAVSRIYGTGVTGVVVTGASTSTTENITVVLRGTIRTTGTTTFTPQIQYSAAPGGAPTVLSGSYFRLVSLGTNSVTSVGTWS